MADINIVDAKPLFTKGLVDVYKEVTTPTQFLRSFFRVQERSTKELSIAVQRGTEKVAVDIVRGQQGNRNEFGLSTEKIIVPPYYREYFDATDLDFYDRIFGDGQGGTVSGRTFAEWVSMTAEKMVELQNKIERAYELQAAQVFEDGIVQLNGGTNIDFKRKAGSKIAYAAGIDFSSSSVDPREVLQDGADFIRKNGKYSGGIFNAVLGSEALTAFLNNDTIKEVGDLRRIDLVSLRQGQNIEGGMLHGELSCGPYIVRIWSYPEYYEASNGTLTPYIDSKKFFMIPESPRFTHGFAAVPHIIRDAANAEFPSYIRQTQGAYMIGNYIDPVAEKHVFDIKSAGVCIPTAVDQIYTAQVISS